MEEKRPGEALHIVRVLYKGVTADEYRALRAHFDQPAVRHQLGGTVDLIGYVGALDIQLRTTTAHVGECPEAMLRSEIAMVRLALSERQPVPA